MSGKSFWQTILNAIDTGKKETSSTGSIHNRKAKINNTQLEVIKDQLIF